MHSFNQSPANMSSYYSFIDLMTQYHKVLIDRLETIDDCLPSEANYVVKLLKAFSFLDTFLERFKFL